MWGTFKDSILQLSHLPKFHHYGGDGSPVSLQFCHFGSKSSNKESSNDCLWLLPHPSTLNDSFTHLQFATVEGMVPPFLIASFTSSEVIGITSLQQWVWFLHLPAVSLWQWGLLLYLPESILPKQVVRQSLGALSVLPRQTFRWDYCPI